jgi:predicted ester cyclase
MSTDHTTLARRFFEESDRGRTPGELCGPGFTAHFPGFPPMDLAAYDQFAAMFHAPFSEIKHPIDEVIGDGDKVAVRLRFEGTHTGEFMGVPASGRHFSIEGTAFLHVADTKIVDLWGSLDTMGLMQQIGGLPIPSQAG